MSFKDGVAADNVRVFMNIGEFAETHDIRYDGEVYKDVDCVITRLKERDRNPAVKDHAQGIYMVTARFHCPLDALGGNIPEKGTKIAISDDDFWREYYVALSGCDLQMINLDLEAMDE